LAAQEQVRAVPATSLNYGYMGFNWRDPANAARPHPLFSDIGIRRALAMAIDRRALLKNVYDTLAYLGSGPFSRTLATADTALAMPAFDAAGAGRLLDSLGWRDGDGDGVREKGGRPLRFGLMFPATSPPRRRYAELIQAQLRPVGVQVDVDGADISVVGERMFTGKFDALINNWASDPSPGALRGSWHSATPANRASNLQLYGSAAADAAMDSAANALDPEQGRRLYRAAYQRIADDVAAVWLYENRAFLALNRRVQPVPGTDAWWRNLRFWSIPPAGRLPRDR
ncbi:partial Oligopeptide-binding protein AppA, partial [Gammaproteobacteria bacterium]